MVNATATIQRYEKMRLKVNRWIAKAPMKNERRKNATVRTDYRDNVSEALLRSESSNAIEVNIQ